MLFRHTAAAHRSAAIPQRETGAALRRTALTALIGLAACSSHVASVAAPRALAAHAAPDARSSADAVPPDADFSRRFHHGMATVDGLRLHYVEGGTGRPVLLIPGWPQSWFAWRDLMPALADAGYRVIAVDPRGMGDSSHPAGGYDLKTLAADLHRLAMALDLPRNGPFAVVGHDVGAWIAYAYAADWPADVGQLAVLEAALPGITPQFTNGIPSAEANVRTWHFGFNRLDHLPEILVQGHERAYLSWLFQQKSVKPWVFTPEVLDVYERAFTQPGGAHAAFSYYREAFSDTGLAQNRERAQRPLGMPVLAVGAQHGVGDTMAQTMKGLAAQLQSVQVPGCGHYVMEECPEPTAQALLDFLRGASPHPARR